MIYTSVKFLLLRKKTGSSLWYLAVGVGGKKGEAWAVILKMEGGYEIVGTSTLEYAIFLPQSFQKQLDVLTEDLFLFDDPLHKLILHKE